MSINKSLSTNTIASSLIGLSYLSEAMQPQLFNAGFYALSGSLTNWLAIHMLFERVPGLYGSGIIPNKFEEFKRGIRQLMMNQFFTKEHIERFFQQQSEDHQLDFQPMIDSLDYELLFEKLKQGVLESPLGGMLQMFGGPEVLDKMKEPMILKLKEALKELSQELSFQENIAQAISQSLHLDQLIVRISHIVESRLDELTPQMVKEIIQDMIREHLGWLVVWGGFFGGLIGLVVSLLPA